jgi:2-amino-4-hydroxy-6-hydroxymethyldihydropteridine diphosphokinase
VSTIYQTPALDRPEQDDFLNGACRLSEAPPPRVLQSNVLRPIEERLGRVRGPDKYAARTIDLDIALCGDITLGEPDLTIPDPDIHTRAFLAVPLFELAPQAVLPDSGEALRAIAQTLDLQGMKPLPEYTDTLKARFTA